MYNTFIGNRNELWKVAERKKIHISNLETSLDKPYFARIDFTYSGEDKIHTIYIRKNGVSQKTNIIITDWRAPISSLYYDAEVGECSFEAPDGIINGIMNLKRQYEIENGELIDYFDVDLVSNDGLLQKYLNSNNDARLKSIVSTIQKEQNDVIRRKMIDITLFSNRLDESKMQIGIIKSLNSFNDIGTYHNYTSKVMPKYTKKEADFLANEFSNKNSKVLDIMCGYGRITNQLKKLGYNDITGIDMGDYNFLGVPKDFIFIKNDFLNYKFSDNYDYAYSLYNCYKDNEELYQILKKSHSLLNENGKLVIDCFNKSWRDSIDKDFYKELYIDENYKLIIKRDYDLKTGNELTVYELYQGNTKIKDFTFVQRFFRIEDILEILDNKWSYNLENSNNLQTRNNSQKHIMILRKK